MTPNTRRQTVVATKAAPPLRLITVGQDNQKEKQGMMIRLLIFIAIWFGILLSGKLQEQLLTFLCPIQIVLFFVLLSSYMKSLKKNDIKYESGWKRSAWLAFLMGTSITLPFAVFRVTPEGPAEILSIFDYVKFLLGVLLSGVGFGLVSVLVAVIFINQFYPNRNT